MRGEHGSVGVLFCGIPEACTDAARVFEKAIFLGKKEFLSSATGTILVVVPLSHTVTAQNGTSVGACQKLWIFSSLRLSCRKHAQMSSSKVTK